MSATGKRGGGTGHKKAAKGKTKRKTRKKSAEATKKAAAKRKRKPGPVVSEHDPDAVPAVEASPASAPAAETAETAETAEAAETAEPGAEGAGDILLQDWSPLSQCLDWKLGRIAWAISADQLFEDGRVPNLTHDSGTLSLRNARVLAAWCAEQAAGQALPDQIVVVELGMGTGLHLRYLLDHFQQICTDGGHDWYGRLSVYATDVSTALLAKAKERGLFEAHAEHVQTGYIDLASPGLFIDPDTGDQTDLRGGIHLLCANYVLDLLPIDVFRRSMISDNGAGRSTRWEALMARTWLRAVERLPAYTDLTLAQIQALAASDDAQAWRALTSLYSLLQLELRTFEVPIAAHPDLDELVRLANRQEAALGEGHELLAAGTIVYHSGGALRVATELGSILADNGYATLRDIGLTSAELAAVPRIHQHFGTTVAAGVNMVQLDDWLSNNRSGSGVRAVAPAHDGVDNHAARLLTRATLPATEAAFSEHFDGESMGLVGRTIWSAREEADTETSLARYREALALEPGNWLLLGEAAACALQGGQAPDLALVIARQGLEVNPGYNADLWNIYGDALWAGGDGANALVAYQYALQTNPRHARSHYCLAYVQAERGRFEQAFRHIGEALALDAAGAVRGEVLQLLDACLRGQRLAWEAEQERLATRAAR